MKVFQRTLGQDSETGAFPLRSLVFSLGSKDSPVEKGEEMEKKWKKEMEKISLSAEDCAGRAGGHGGHLAMGGERQGAAFYAMSLISLVSLFHFISLELFLFRKVTERSKF